MLAGITLQGQGSDGQVMHQRPSTWAYDKSGRAILSVKGAYDAAKAGIEQVSIVFDTQKARRQRPQQRALPV